MIVSAVLLVLEVTEQSVGGLPGPFVRGVEKLAADPLNRWWHVILRGVLDDVADQFPQVMSSDVKVGALVGQGANGTQPQARNRERGRREIERLVLRFLAG
jgi:hypothetical protein